MAAETDVVVDADAAPETHWRQTWGGAQGHLPEVELRPERTALLVIDLQYLYHRDFGVGAHLKKLGTFDSRRYMYDRLDDLVIPNTQRLLNACRSIGVRVIYTRNCALAADGSDGWSNWRRDGKQQGVNWCVAGSKESEILDEVRPFDTDIVMNKTSSGVFNSTAIDTMLRNMGVTALLFCGAATNYCVETSIRGAGDRGYHAVLVDDACAAINERQERLAREVLDGVYCRVLSTERVLEMVYASATMPV